MNGLAWLMAALVPAAAGAAWWAARREQRLAAQLRSARADLASLSDMLDVWQWRTDADHRLVQLRPPHGAAPADWSAEPLSAPLWEAFPAAEVDALRVRVASHAPLDDIDVTRTGGRPARLRGRPILDEHGAFAGYGGVLLERAEAPVPAAVSAVPVAPPAPVPTADADHESFSYTVSHDLRAPIRVVEGFTKILKEDYGRLLDRIGNDHLDRVLGAAARMNAMIDALLALARLSSQPVASQPVNLTQLAGYVAEDLRRQWPERPVQLHVQPDLQAQGDPTLLRVVLENLLGNAWKYTGKCSAPEVWFEQDARGVYTVRDNGAGFDMRFADRLFGVFQRLHSATEFQGTGIGLASVRRIVRRHGGEIWAEAEVGHGARFHFTLR